MTSHKHEAIEIPFGRTTCIHCFILDNLMAIAELRSGAPPSSIVVSALRAVADFVCLHNQNPEHLQRVLQTMKAVLSERIAKDLQDLQEIKDPLLCPSTVTKQ